MDDLVSPVSSGEEDDTVTVRDSKLIEFKFPKKKGKKVMKWFVNGLSKSKAKLYRSKYHPKFNGSFKLTNPEMDDAVYERLRSVKRSRSSKERIYLAEKELGAIQFKLLDIGRSLFYLWENATNLKLRKAAKVWVMQWAHTNFSVFDARCRNLLKQTYPAFVSLLKRPNNFNDKEFAFLFDDHFSGKWSKWLGMVQP